MLEKMALITPEDPSAQNSNGNHDSDVTSSSGYSSHFQKDNSVQQQPLSLQTSSSIYSKIHHHNDQTPLVPMVHNRNNRHFVKRGSLTINSVPQQFNYDASRMELERLSQETKLNVATSATTNNANDGPAVRPDHADECTSDAEMLDADVTSGRPSNSSSRQSNQVSWRPWIDTTCCFGYFHLRCTWIFHPQGPLSYVWLFVVSIAVLHNIVHIPLRYAFGGWNMNLGLAATTDDIISGSNNISSALTAIPSTFSGRDLAFWMVPDYFFDLIYVLDIFKSMRTGFFEEGFMNSHPQAIFSYYVGSASFYADILSLLPLDLLYLSFGLNSMLRIPRIIKIYRCFQFANWTERHTSRPNVIRSIKLFIYVLIICHWNAALGKTALQGYEKIWFHNDHTVGNATSSASKASNLFLASAPDLKYYWAWLYVSVSTLCTLGLSGTTGLSYDEPAFIFVFLTFQMMLGLVLFAVAIGEILLIVDSLGASRREFQMHLDAVKNYMGKRDIPKPVTVKVIRWFDYIWESRRGFDEERRHLMVLPDCLQSDISLHAYLHTLKQVEFFRNTEAGFLRELVLKLKPILFSPGEYVCRKGEIGRTMYIIEVGLLQVFSGKHVNSKPVAHLKRGQYFGELSILNMGKAGNRRTATIRSVGYSHLLSLCKEDLFSVLQDFPKERARLEYFAGKRCEQYHQEKIQERLKRQQSRETINQLLVNEHVAPWSTNVNSERMGTAITATTGVDHHYVETSSSSAVPPESLDGDPLQNVKQWRADTAASASPIRPEDFVSECDLSPIALNEACSKTNNDERRASLNTPHSTPRKNSYRMRQSNLIARINAAAHTGSPLLSRIARSMEAISGRESTL